MIFHATIHAETWIDSLGLCQFIQISSWCQLELWCFVLIKAFNRLGLLPCTVLPPGDETWNAEKDCAAWVKIMAWWCEACIGIITPLWTNLMRVLWFIGNLPNLIRTDILGWWHSIVGYSRHNSVTHQNIITFFCFRAPRIGPVNDVEMMEMVDEVKGLFEI